MLDRVKFAIKYLMGRSTLSPTALTHEYHLYIDNQNIFDKKVVLVTGGTGGIGSAICYDLAAKGARVGISGRNESKIFDTIERISKGSSGITDRLIPIVLDVNNDDQIASVINLFAKKEGKIDVFINNAGGQPGKLGDFSENLFERSIEQIDLIINTNIRGTIVCCKEISAIMARQGFGHIISMSSVIGLRGKAGYADYSASKAAIVGLTQSLALEMSKYNVRVNCISPGTINQVPFDGGSEAVPSKLNPTLRTGYTREIAETVSFLMTNEFITGQNIIVDGGRSLGLYGDSNS